MSALVPFSEALRLDAELVRLARGASAVRIAVGRALESLASSAGHYELGFSSLEAYARERCERSGRWAADTRALSRRLASLPNIREALESGAIGWSTAELLARYVTADSEVAWLEKACENTVRELRALFADGTAGDIHDAESEPTRKLTVSVTREDGWLFECARKTVEAVAGTRSSDELLQSLLAEGFSTLLELVPDCSAHFEIDELENAAAVESQAQAAWCAERQRWRREAEELCARRWSAAPSEACVKLRSVSSPETPKTPEALDREIRRLSLELLEHDLALGIVAERARQAEVWRRLRFATEVQYASERLGVSLSSLKAKRILAARSARVPELGEALASGRVGYEAAYLLSRVVTPRTAEAWIRRAEMRTVKHLREEVEAAELLIRSGEPREQQPLDDAGLDILFELERSIVSGDWVGRARDSWAGEGAKRDARDTGQISGGRPTRTFGRVTLRWNVTEGTYRFFRVLERVFARVSTRVGRERMSFLRFLCENFCRIWLPALRKRPCEYFAVYRRDVFRCTSPVCTRRDVTPHHLVFRSRGGGDEDDNVTSLCLWCHLSGVHEGRIAAEPPASKIRWRIGRKTTLRIEGRDLTLR